jgi:uncharacterized phage-associated protein
MEYDMASIHDVAKYFLLQTDEEAGDTISNLKLQKLVYYAQGFHLAMHGTPLFNDQIQAWTHGPVTPALYHAYKECGSDAIAKPTEFDASGLTTEETELLDEVYSVYGQFSGWKLRNLTHEEAPWQDAYKEGANTEITHESLHGFFVSQLN